MPATPAEPPRRATRRDQRAGQRRAWSALDTPHGFERCVRATLRELYGYVALLCGRDRKEAERLVGEVYRSLFRAVGAGHVDSVTLGALRSAARRAWLEEHRTELAATDEVSRAPVSTIAELSPLERAVLVLRHVNGMSDDRAGVELGRSEREITALDAHAVRRLRGTDDTSGAWLRAYLGPTVSPSAGLVDRIVQQLGDEDAPAAEVEPASDEPAPDEPALTVPDGDTDRPGPEPTGVGPADGGDAAVHGDADDDVAATTELSVVERPTVEVPMIATMAPVDPEPPDRAPVGAPIDPALVGPAPATTLDGDDVDPGRPRWVVAVAVVLLAGLAVALIWLVLRGDPDDTVESTADTSADSTEETPTEATSTATVPATTEPGATSTTEPAAVVVPTDAPVALGFDPVCVDRTGAEPAATSWSESFGPLATEAVLTIVLPDSVDVAADPARAAPRPTAILRPDGLVVAVGPASGHGGTGTVVARVGLDGTVAWVRCFDEQVRIGTAPDAGVDLAVRPTADDGAWTALSIADGSEGDALDPVQSGIIDAPTDPEETSDGPTLGFSYSSELGRSVLAGLDDGRVLWTAPDVVLPAADEFRAAAIDGTVVAQSCVETDDGPDCEAGELRGYDLATGELLWSRAGSFELATWGDSFALAGGSGGWVLIDVRTGEPVDGQRWDVETFDVGDDPDVGFVVRDGGALVVARPGTVSVWLPDGDDSASTTVAIP